MADTSEELENLNGLMRKEGYLRKQSQHLKQFRKRWIVLDEGKLFSFQKQKGKKAATEIFDLSIYNQVRRSINGKTYEFELISTVNDKKRVFLGKSIDDMISWMMEIRKHQQKMNEKMNKNIGIGNFGMHMEIQNRVK
mmetsp:Transcript_61958/g.55902  ORF Transcript_61958/g.55902 Transcript_61958/m.55902 type:complete len:138 (-) Transcript_61958:7-420(-)